jgi:hypothetical protein
LILGGGQHLDELASVVAQLLQTVAVDRGRHIA